MKLTTQQIRSATLGAVRINEVHGSPRFYRFNAAEDALYLERDASLGRNFHDRALCPAGVKLLFQTNSQTLSIAAEVVKRSSRTFFAFDVVVNGRFVGSLCNFTEQAVPAGYTSAEMPFPLGRFEKEFALGTGEKTVAIYFPWSVEVVDFSLSLQDSAKFAPVKSQKKMLVYGDSITQGYDALHPHRRYGARLADVLDAEEVNKAIGGEIFFPALARVKADFVPDIVTVAYGTNDWSTTEGANFIASAREFFTALSANYPDVKIFAIAPIYRKDMNASKPFGTFSSVAQRIREVTAALPNVTVIDGITLVPHDFTLYADLRLHPTDAGFDHYTENLIHLIGGLL